MGDSKEVDAWFKRYENPMKEVVLRVREIVLGADERIDECIKWQAPTFTYRGNLASFFPKSKKHASLMFHLGAKIPGRHPRLEGTGDTGRVLKIASVLEANTAKRDIERVVKAWCAWRDETEPAATPRGPTKIATVKRTNVKPLEPLLAPIAKGFAKDPSVNHLKSTSLRVGKKVFVMLVRGELVLKLPATRVQELVDAGTGRPFDAGKGMIMKEWVTFPVTKRAKWLALSRESRAFVGKR